MSDGDGIKTEENGGTDWWGGLLSVGKEYLASRERQSVVASNERIAAINAESRNVIASNKQPVFNPMSFLTRQLPAQQGAASIQPGFNFSGLMPLVLVLGAVVIARRLL